eukprot:16439725-Heterocapsa_arctica.AAC.1
MESKWRDGVFVGIRERSDEILVMTETGVYKARLYRRMPEEARWDADFLSKLIGVPWDPVPAPEGETVLPAIIEVIPAVAQAVPEVKAARDEIPIPRR